MRILLVEDNVKLARNIVTVLKNNGYLIEYVTQGKEALEKSYDTTFDLIILDLALPDIEGKDVCRKLREEGFVSPILMLTAKINLESKVEGLDCGADDYLTKPFLMEELLARIRALSRRLSHQKSSVVNIQNITFDLSSRLIHKNRKLINLTPIEKRLLEYLVLNRGEVKTSGEIYESVWGNSPDLDFSSTLKTHIFRLRKKVGEDLIQTVTGFGYIVQ